MGGRDAWAGGGSLWAAQVRSGAVMQAAWLRTGHSDTTRWQAA